MSYTEFVKVEKILSRSKEPAKRLYFEDVERPITFQIYGDDPDLILKAALKIEPLNPDIIDLNMGCPAKSIADRGAGVGMMLSPDKVAETFKKLTSALKVPVTGKIRLGWDKNKNYKLIARIVEEEGGSLIAIHGRTKEQRYSGDADWDAIAEVKSMVRIPVIGSGDVRTVADIQRMKQHTNCDAVMIGRGAFGNPWIFREARALLERGEVLPPATPRERLGALLRQYRMAVTITNPRHATNEIKKHVAWYVKGLPNAVPFKERGQRIAEPADLEALVAAYLAELAARGVADLPGGVAARPVAVGAGAGATEPQDDAWQADDGSAEAASLAAQES